MMRPWSHNTCFLLIAVCLAFLLPVCRVIAQEPQPQEPQQELHWAIKLGLRSHQVSQAFPLVDRVVLVPDAATFLDELSKWSPRGRWPVLFDEPQFAPMFVRRFKPAEVIRRSSVGELPEEKRNREKLLENIIVSAWGGDPGIVSIEEIFKRHDYAPPGVVVTSVDDSAWTAAIVLAAGHGQPLLFLDGRFGEERAVASETVVTRFNAQLETAVDALPWSRRELGDDIDAITVCRDMAVRTRIPNASDEFDGFAFTDMIGRNADDSRWAFTGWIFGSEARAAYVAMCSLFLDRTDALLVNTYPDEGDWSTYGLLNVNAAMQQIGFAVTYHGNNWANLNNWLRMLTAGVTSDVIFINTRGMREFFELAEGRAHACDVPVLNTPAAVHFIHSFSMFDPTDATTVAGRWIDHGAYAYVGSVVEPTLAGFVPPMNVTERLVNFVPFLVAARHWDQPWSRTGKIATFGDPLMLIGQPEQMKKERVPPDGAKSGINLNDRARALMREIKEKPTTKAYAEVIDVLVMLGKDTIAAEMWKHAQTAGSAEAGADRALGAFFRLNKRAEFMQAWDQMLTRTDHDIDMLWHLWSGNLGAADDDTLLQLQSAIRPGQPEVDLERLLPHLHSAFGMQHAARVIDREIEKASDDRTRKKLRELNRR